jgi:hypothetical protein
MTDTTPGIPAACRIAGREALGRCVLMDSARYSSLLRSISSGEKLALALASAWLEVELVDIALVYNERIAQDDFATTNLQRA